MTHQIELEEIIKTIIRIVFHMFKKLEENLSTISGDMQDIKKRAKINFQRWKSRNKLKLKIPEKGQ